MSKEFQKKLQLYKEGQLEPNKVSEIECELDKFSAIWEHLNDDDMTFLEALKQQPPADPKEENNLSKLLKRKVNLRILMMTILSVFSVLILTIFLCFLTSNITTSLFGLNYKESYVKREEIVQLARIFHPQYRSYQSGVEKSLFAQQNIYVSLNNRVGNTLIDTTELHVRYSFGHPVKSEAPTDAPPLLPLEASSLLNSHEPDRLSGFKILEKAPQGTEAKIFVEFTQPLTPQQLKEHFIDQISPVDSASLEIIPLAAIGSEFVLANPSYYQLTPIFPYGNNEQLKDNGIKQAQYDNMKDEAHKESLLSNLTLINNNKKLLQVMYPNNMFENLTVDDMINHVENNGVEYIGMYLSADSKDLLNLKYTPLIHCMRVENIVVW